MKYIKKYNENIEWNWVQEENDDSIPYDFKGYKDFYKFLVDNNALDNYLKNRNGHIVTDDIAASFVWGGTVEGWKYWYDLREKWYKKRKEND